jgi:4-amino-4-deoxy-L-arabinose transferase-like glycosyltransferase
VLNIVLGTAIVGLTIHLGRIFFGEATAILAGAIMAVWPSEVAYVTILASELPFMFLVLLGFAAWFSPQVPSSLRPLACGLAFGAAGYVRPLALLLPIVLWISALPNWRVMRDQFPRVAVAMIVMAVVIAPWSVRNTMVFGHFVLLSTNGGSNLWMGNNPETNGFYGPLPASTKSLNEYERDKTLGAQAAHYILAEPVAFVFRTLKKAARLHAGETIAVHWNAEGLKHQFGERVLFPLKLLTQGFWTVALVLALAGLVVMGLERGVISTLTHPIVLTLGYYTAFYAVTVVQDRYHFPSHPFMSMLIAIVLLAAVGRGTKRTKPFHA